MWSFKQEQQQDGIERLYDLQQNNVAVKEGFFQIRKKKFLSLSTLFSFNKNFKHSLAIDQFRLGPLKHKQ